MRGRCRHNAIPPSLHPRDNHCMKILATNDDGIGSQGLAAAVAVLSSIGEVTVFAPSSQRSGAGTAIGDLAEPLPLIHQCPSDRFAGATAAYHFDGPPALAALLACKGLFGHPPDLVVSGINRGWNVGQTVYFSGTVGAAIAAAVLNVPAIAISQRSGTTTRWSTAATVLGDFIAGHDPLPRLVNINVPNVEYCDLRGTLDTQLSARSPFTMAGASMLPTSDNTFVADFEHGGRYHNFVGSDARSVEEDYVSVSLLSTMTT